MTENTVLYDETTRAAALNRLRREHTHPLADDQLGDLIPAAKTHAGVMAHFAGRKAEPSADEPAGKTVADDDDISDLIPKARTAVEIWAAYNAPVKATGRAGKVLA